MKEDACVFGYRCCNSSENVDENLKFWQYLCDGCNVLCGYCNAPKLGLSYEWPKLGITIVAWPRAVRPRYSRMKVLGFRDNHCRKWPCNNIYIYYTKCPIYNKFEYVQFEHTALPLIMPGISNFENGFALYGFLKSAQSELLPVVSNRKLSIPVSWQVSPKGRSDV